jgi:MFS family permease
MPAGIGHAYAFQVFNTMSFSIVVGMPMVLFIKSLEVSATVLGLVMALPPLLNVLQIPAAQFVERFGYRNFVLKGWTTRTFVILAMAGVAVLPGKIDRTTRLALMLFLLFVYNASRGISACGFLPWLTQLVPEALRGRYLSRDQMATALAMLGTMTATAWFTHDAAGTARYAWMFVVAFLAGLLSLTFLSRIPDVPVPESNRSRGPVPWRALTLHPPFLRLLIYDVVLLVALAGGGVAWVPLLRDVYAFADWQILGMMAVGAAVTAFVLWVFGPIADRVGSQPLLGVAGMVFMVHFGVWGVLAAGVWGATLGVILILQITAAIALSLFGLANTRLAMSVVPETGRSHFFALFSVITSLTAGILPVFWGILIDSLAGWETAWGAWRWNQYSVTYAGIFIFIVLAQICQRRLQEPRAMPTDVFLHELLVKTPSQAITRLITRKPLG